MAKSNKHQKHIKMTRTLYLLGYRDYFDGRPRDRHLFSVLSNKEQKAYLKGQKRALRTLMKERKDAVGLSLGIPSNTRNKKTSPS